ncbi:MAG: hypothetical protein KAS32_09545 [Candidatus Peribacteraceae bacterium]|nr:hypothetical protein [Candidatus Peribacteraceae bacterium]
MKVQLTKHLLLANPVPSKPHWRFAKDQIITTDDEYLINRLLELKCAKILDKSCGTNAATDDLTEELKMHKVTNNKMLDLSKMPNKGITKTTTKKATKTKKNTTKPKTTK